METLVHPTAPDRDSHDDHCPMRIRLTVIRSRRTTTEPWQEVQILPGSSQEAALTELLLKGLYDGEVLDLLDPGSMREIDVHPDPCPLCRHRAQPGPRVQAMWHTDGQIAAERHQGWRETDPRDLIELPNADAAEAWVRDIARHRLRHQGLLRSAELTLFQVPVDPDRPAAYTTLIAEPGSELWLWNTPPASRRQLRNPDQVLSLTADGGVLSLPGMEAAARRPERRLPESTSMFKTVEGADGRRLTWFNDSEGRLVSVLDPRSTEPAKRVHDDRPDETLHGAPDGLVVFGSHAADRPPLSDLARLAPDFADLAPALPRRSGKQR
ncbi:hypothetical protein ACIQF6_28570 [Kitasatospora sp. NPDC092948]|uniref:hypothetical protein n=1 Tax=Kitasatospora sp. NPDC092948 TaxID=3364088 RepID=UPI00382558D6